MKTILITSFHPLISRNILYTDAIFQLKKNDTKIFVITREKKRPFLEREVIGVSFVGIEYRPRLADKFLNYLALAALHSVSMKIKRRTDMRGSGRILSLFLRGMWSKKLIRALDGVLVRGSAFDSILETVSPDLIFSTDIQHSSDTALSRAAERKNIPVIGMVRSWDNPTSKGIIRFIPRKILVHNDILRRELETLHGIPREKIEIVGIPHYDSYFSAEIDKAAFFKKTGLDLAKKFALYVPTGDRYLENNSVDRDIVDLLDQYLPKDWQILVRFPITDTVANLEGKKNYGRVLFDRPDMNFELHKNNELSKEGEEHLKATLKLCSMVISGPSTMVIDAAIFDKPVNLVGFDGKERRPYFKSIARYYDYNHWQAIKESNGAPLAKSENEFTSLIFAYIADPSLNSSGRKKIVEGELCFLDGKSSERVAKSIINMIDASLPSFKK